MVKRGIGTFFNIGVVMTIKVSGVLAIGLLSFGFGVRAADELVSSSISTSSGVVLAGGAKKPTARYKVALEQSEVAALEADVCRGDWQKVLSDCDLMDPILAEQFLTQKAKELHVPAIYSLLKKHSEHLARPLGDILVNARTAVSILQILGEMTDASVKPEMKQGLSVQAKELLDTKSKQYFSDVRVEQLGISVQEYFRAELFASSIADTLNMFQSRVDHVRSEGESDLIEEGRNGLEGFLDFFRDTQSSDWLAGVVWEQKGASTWLGAIGNAAAHIVGSEGSSAVTWNAPSDEQKTWFKEYDTYKKATPFDDKRKDARDAVRAAKMVAFLKAWAEIYKEFEGVCQREGKEAQDVLPEESFQAITRILQAHRLLQG